MADFGRFPGFVAVQKAFGTSMLFRGFRGFRWKNPPLEGKNAWRASKLVVPQSRDLLHFVGPLGFPFSRALWGARGRSAGALPRTGRHYGGLARGRSAFCLVLPATVLVLLGRELLCLVLGRGPRARAANSSGTPLRVSEPGGAAPLGRLRPAAPPASANSQRRGCRTFGA